MTINSRFQVTQSGFTLTELLTVLAIVSILVAAAGASYPRFISKAKSVAAEIALSEINRLQQTYYASNGMYASSIDELGFKPVPPLKYYSVSVEVVGKPGNAAFRALAMPLSGSTGQTLSVVQYAQTQPSTGNGASGVFGTAGGSTGMAFGGEGWEDDVGIIHLDPTVTPKGGIEKVVENPRSTADSAPTMK